MRIAVLIAVVATSVGCCARLHAASDPVRIDTRIIDFLLDSRRGWIEVDFDVPNRDGVGTEGWFLRRNERDGASGFAGWGRAKYSMRNGRISARILFCRPAAFDVSFYLQVTDVKYSGATTLRAFTATTDDIKVAAIQRRWWEPEANLCTGFDGEFKSEAPIIRPDWLHQLRMRDPSLDRGYDVSELGIGVMRVIDPDFERDESGLMGQLSDAAIWSPVAMGVLFAFLVLVLGVTWLWFRYRRVRQSRPVSLGVLQATGAQPVGGPLLAVVLPATKAAPQPEDAAETIHKLQDRVVKPVKEVQKKEDSLRVMSRQTPLPSKDYEGAMAATLTEWWKSDNPDRSQLLRMLHAIGLPAKFCEVTNTDSINPSTFQFLDSEKGGWLWVGAGVSPVFALPADREFFKADMALRLISQVVSGCEYDKTRVHFEEAVAACELEVLASGRYKVMKKGAIKCRDRARPTKDSVRPYRDFLEHLPRPSEKSEPVPPPTTELVSGTQVVLQGLGGKIAVLGLELAKLSERVSSLEVSILQAQQARDGRMRRATKVEQRVVTSLEEPPKPSPALPATWSATSLRGVYDGLDLPGVAYLGRLDMLRTSLSPLCGEDMALGVAHVSTNDGHMFRVEKLSPPEAERLTHQMFVIVVHGDDHWVFLPPGEIQRYCYPMGYEALVRMPSGESWEECAIRMVVRPALLRLVKGKGFEVVAAMEVEVGE